MIRLLVPVGALAVGEVVRVDDDEVHHLEVRRVVEGTEVEALDGAGGRAVGVLQALDPEFSIDLVLFDEASPGLQKTILHEGIDL